jgi:hypothetical protein
MLDSVPKTQSQDPQRRAWQTGRQLRLLGLVAGIIVLLIIAAQLAHHLFEPPPPVAEVPPPPGTFRPTA